MSTIHTSTRKKKIKCLDRWTTTNHYVKATIEGKLTRAQLDSLNAVIYNSGTTFYGPDIKGYLVSQLGRLFPKVGAGGSHVWCSNATNDRLVIITIDTKGPFYTIKA